MGQCIGDGCYAAVGMGQAVVGIIFIAVVKSIGLTVLVAYKVYLAAYQIVFIIYPFQAGIGAVLVQAVNLLPQGFYVAVQVVIVIGGA